MTEATETERAINRNVAAANDRTVTEIAALADSLRRAADGSRAQFQRARELGNEIATALLAFYADPDAIDAVRAAYDRWMTADSGNFAVSPETTKEQPNE